MKGTTMQNNDLGWEVTTQYGEMHIWVGDDANVEIGTKYEEPIIINKVRYRGSWSFVVGFDGAWQFDGRKHNSFRRVDKWDACLSKSASNKLHNEIDNILAANQKRIFDVFSVGKKAGLLRKIESIDEKIAKLQKEKTDLQAVISKPRQLRVWRDGGNTPFTGNYEVIPPTSNEEFRSAYTKALGVALSASDNFLAFGRIERMCVHYPHRKGEAQEGMFRPDCHYYIDEC
jgi:hypothetical protein